MNETNFENQLSNIIDEIVGNHLPLQHAKLAKLAKQVKERLGKHQSSSDRLQETLNALRVYVKYQQFDLEATKRENIYLRKLLLEESND